MIATLSIAERLRQLLIGQTCVVTTIKKLGRRDEVEPRVRIDNVSDLFSVVGDHATYCGHSNPVIDTSTRTITFQCSSADDRGCDVLRRHFTVINQNARRRYMPYETALEEALWLEMADEL